MKMRIRYSESVQSAKSHLATRKMSPHRPNWSWHFAISKVAPATLNQMIINPNSVSSPSTSAGSVTATSACERKILNPSNRAHWWKWRVYGGKYGKAVCTPLGFVWGLLSLPYRLWWTAFGPFGTVHVFLCADRFPSPPTVHGLTLTIFRSTVQ